LRIKRENRLRLSKEQALCIRLALSLQLDRDSSARKEAAANKKKFSPNKKKFSPNGNKISLNGIGKKSLTI
jgi:hypothetical protein